MAVSYNIQRLAAALYKPQNGKKGAAYSPKITVTIIKPEFLLSTVSVHTVINSIE